MSQISTEKIEDVRTIFSDYLKKKNLRQTPERFLVFDEVYAHDDHFDADELYLRLKENGVNVSRATVYNSLELLMECNLVVRHQFDSKQAKYERSFRFWQHDHLICLDCNELFEFCDPRIQGIQEMVSDIFKFDITHHSLEMYGHCNREECANKKSVQTPD